MSSNWPDLESWKEYGISRHHNSKKPISFRQSKDKVERTWYRIGAENKWLREFSFNRIKPDYSSLDLESWKKEGLNKGYNQRTPTSLQRSKISSERHWYNLGARRRWTASLTFDRKKINCKWETEKDWIDFGTREQYSEKTATSLMKSKDREERSWYYKGQRTAWIFNFSLKKPNLTRVWKTFEEWKNKGVARNYHDRFPSSLEESEKIEERSWYQTGVRRGWIKNFKFNNKRISGRWRDENEWARHGLKRGFNKRGPKSLEKSKNKDERSWFNKGVRECWDFDFSRFAQRGRWLDVSSWVKYGLEKLYQERNISSLARSEKNDERAWYSKGQKEKWLKDFNFKWRKPSTSPWKNEKYAIKRAIKVMDIEGWSDLPGRWILERRGYKDLAGGISKHYGFCDFRQKLNEYLERPSRDKELTSLLENYVGGTEHE